MVALWSNFSLVSLLCVALLVVGSLPTALAVELQQRGTPGCISGYSECPDEIHCCPDGYTCRTSDCIKPATPADSIWWAYLLGAIGLSCVAGCARQACAPGPSESYTALNAERQELLAANSQPGRSSAGPKPSVAVLSPQMHGR